MHCANASKQLAFAVLLSIVNRALEIVYHGKQARDQLLRGAGLLGFTLLVRAPAVGVPLGVKAHELVFPLGSLGLRGSKLGCCLLRLGLRIVGKLLALGTLGGLFRFLGLALEHFCLYRLGGSALRSRLRIGRGGAIVGAGWGGGGSLCARVGIIDGNTHGVVLSRFRHSDYLPSFLSSSTTS